jgi:hypothetical protein
MESTQRVKYPRLSHMVAFFQSLSCGNAQLVVERARAKTGESY